MIKLTIWITIILLLGSVNFIEETVLFMWSTENTKEAPMKTLSEIFHAGAFFGCKTATTDTKVFARINSIVKTNSKFFIL